MADKPNIADARWAELADGTAAANMEAPPDAVRDAGWTQGQLAKSRWDNWIKRESYRWMKYVSDGRLSGNIGFYGAAAIAKPTVTGARADGTALASLLAQLATLGLITDSSTAGTQPAATAIAAGAIAAGDLAVTGQLLLANGTAAAPALTFASDPDTGIWRTGANAYSLGAGSSGLATVTSANGFTTSAALINAARVTMAVRRETANYLLTVTDCVVVMAGTSLTLTMPASNYNGQIYFLRNQGATSLTVARNGQTINGAASDITILADANAVMVYMAGQGWFVVG